MKLDNVEISLRIVKTETVDGEYVMYIPSTKQVAMFNKSASIVWKYIVQSFENKRDITTEEVVEKLISEYHLDDSNKSLVSKDVTDLLNHFFESGLIY